jgi:threonine aldolase
MTVNRRAFLRSSGLSALPLLAPAIPAFAGKINAPLPRSEKPINFVSDGDFPDPSAYIQKLQEINAAQAIRNDIYGNGGAVQALEQKFAAITGKERAMFMPTGTMANQLAISVLSGENTKVFVQETSHVYRDEADAAQSVFNKRLIPLAKGQAGFTAAELQQAVEYHDQGEVFKSGIGVVSIENPVRRADGQFIPIDELKKISAYCRKQGYKLHLDGARLYFASAWSGTSIAEYSALFDTVYISLYKYLGAGAGAILCGDKAVIDKMTHLIKIHGGAMFMNWTNAAIALHNLQDYDERIRETRKRGEELIAMLNKLPQIKITHFPSGTNIYTIEFAKGLDAQQATATLANNHNIRMARPNESRIGRFAINHTILYQDLGKTFAAFKSVFS